MSNSSRKITLMITSQRSFASSSFDLRTKKHLLNDFFLWLDPNKTSAEWDLFW